MFTMPLQESTTSPSVNYQPAVGELPRILSDFGLERHHEKLVLTDAKRLTCVEESDPLYDMALIVAALHGGLEIPADFANIRLSALVERCVDMEMRERNALLCLAGPSHVLTRLNDQVFHVELIETLRADRLHELFCHGQGGFWHRGITPCAYNEITGEIYPEEMARWRADYRSMAPERQMMAATIIWLYRSGRDSIWLRRVPCTWSAIDAIRYMKDAGSLSRWLLLLAYFPGW